MIDPNDGPIVISWSPAERADRRSVFKPDPSGGYSHLEQARVDTDDDDDDRWRTVRCEKVDSIDLETPA